MRIRIAILTLAGASLITATSAAPALSDTTDGPPIMAPTGAPTVSTADEMAGALGELGRSSYSDVFSGLRVEGNGQGITVFVKDKARGKSLLATARSTLSTEAISRTSVTIEKARYSKKDLHAARDQLWQEARTWADSGVRIYSISAPADGSGLQVRTNQPALAETRLHASSTKLSLGIPAEFKLGDPIVPATRFHDDPPYAGGAYIQNVSGTVGCTTAFAVRQNGASFLISAAHCFRYGEGTKTGHGRYIGQVVGRGVRDDAASIRTNAWSGVFYQGESWTHYRDSAYSFNGQSVCQSGYPTNSNCGIQIVDDDTTWDFGEGVIWGAAGCSPINAMSAQRGDSGGPVYTWWNDGRLQSRGIVSGIYNMIDNNRGRCMVFTETPRMLRDWGVTLITG